MSINKQFLALLALGFSICLNPLPSFSAEVADVECSQEILLSFFPEVFVREALAQHQIPEAQWAGIIAGLSAKDKELTQLAQANISSLKDLKDSAQRSAAVKQFRDTMQNAVVSVFKQNGITDEDLIVDILDQIQDLRSKRFERCLRKQSESAPSVPRKQVTPAPKPTPKGSPKPVLQASPSTPSKFGH